MLPFDHQTYLLFITRTPGNSMVELSSSTLQSKHPLRYRAASNDKKLPCVLIYDNNVHSNIGLQALITSCHVSLSTITMSTQILQVLIRSCHIDQCAVYHAIFGLGRQLPLMHSLIIAY